MRSGGLGDRPGGALMHHEVRSLPLSASTQALLASFSLCQFARLQLWGSPTKRRIILHTFSQHREQDSSQHSTTTVRSIKHFFNSKAMNLQVFVE